MWSGQNVCRSSSVSCAPGRTAWVSGSMYRSAFMPRIYPRPEGSAMNISLEIQITGALYESEAEFLAAQENKDKEAE